MSELDATWSEMLARESEKARAADRHDVADYLELKASNDLVRQTSVKWLFETLIEHAASANRSSTAVAIERTEPHSFSYRGANLVGSSLAFRYGMRCLIVEAGWTRTPADGFMRGGGLAFARFRHFGMPKAGAEVSLLRVEGTPVWKVLREDQPGPAIDSGELLAHIRLLTEG